MTVGSSLRDALLTSETVDDAAAVLSSVFRRPWSTEELIAKYDVSSLGLPELARVGYRGGRPVAFYGALPMRLRGGDREVNAVQVCDFATLRGHRRSGVHQELGRRVLLGAAEAGIQLGCAMHSQASLASSRWMGWPVLPTMVGRRWRVEFTGMRLLTSLCRRVGMARSWARFGRIRLGASVADESYVAALATARTREPSFLLVEDDLDWLRQRRQEGRLWLRVGEHAVLVRLASSLRIGAVIGPCDRPEVACGLLQRLTLVARRLGLADVEFQGDPRDPWTSAFGGLGGSPFVGFPVTADWLLSSEPRPQVALPSATALRLRWADFDAF